MARISCDTLGDRPVSQLGPTPGVSSATDEPQGGKPVDLQDLDHPVVFVLLMTIAIACMASFLTWGLKAANLPGPAALIQH